MNSIEDVMGMIATEAFEDGALEAAEIRQRREATLKQAVIDAAVEYVEAHRNADLRDCHPEVKRLTAAHPALFAAVDAMTAIEGE